MTDILWRRIDLPRGPRHFVAQLDGPQRSIGAPKSVNTQRFACELLSAGGVVARALPIRGGSRHDVRESAGNRQPFRREFRLWVERLPLNERVPFPYGLRDLRYNPEKSVIGVSVASAPRGQPHRSWRSAWTPGLTSLGHIGWSPALLELTRSRLRSAPPPGWNGWSMLIWPTRSTRARSRPDGRPAICRSARPDPMKSPSKRGMRVGSIA